MFRPSLPLDRTRAARRLYQTQDGIREYEAKNHDYLQQQIGNPDGSEAPNKKYYDPRMPVRAAEEATEARLQQCFSDLNCVSVLGLGDMPPPENVSGPRRGSLPV